MSRNHSEVHATAAAIILVVFILSVLAIIVLAAYGGAVRDMGSTLSNSVVPSEVGAGRASVKDIQTRLLGNFTYVDQGAEDTWVFHTGSEPFAGDCDDFATAGYFQLEANGYEPELVVVGFLDDPPLTPDHLIVCTRKWCLDSRHDVPILRMILRSRYRYAVVDTVEPPSEQYTAWVAGLGEEKSHDN